MSVNVWVEGVPYPLELVLDLEEELAGMSEESLVRRIQDGHFEGRGAYENSKWVRARGHGQTLLSIRPEAIVAVWITE